MLLCSPANLLAASRCSSLYGGADFLPSIIASHGIFFNPASSAPAHKSYSALRSPSAPAGSESVVLQFPQGPLASLCATPQRRRQFRNGKSVAFSFGYRKGAACWPHLCFYVLSFFLAVTQFIKTSPALILVFAEQISLY